MIQPRSRARSAAPSRWRLAAVAPLSLLSLLSCQSLGARSGGASADEALPAIGAGEPMEPVANEVSFAHPRRLTSEGANAEAYWSFDGTRLVFQATRGELECDQVFTLDLATGDLKQVSREGGRTTCAYFLPDGERVIFSSTHLAGEDCPPRPPRSHDIKEYVWPIYPSYDVFLADVEGRILRRLTDTDGYDAEATISPKGDRIVFTSVRDGDIEIYTMALDGTDVRRLTHSVGYDGGPFFSPDGARIVFRSQIPQTPEEEAHYLDLLGRNLVNPTKVELYVMNADGSDRRQVTRNGAANFAPCFTPDGTRIVFSSNLGDPSGRTFHLYSIDVDGTDVRQLTFDGTFNCFPHFSPDGRRLVFISNRWAKEGFRTYDIVLADWNGDAEARRIGDKAP